MAQRSVHQWDGRVWQLDDSCVVGQELVRWWGGQLVGAASSDLDLRCSSECLEQGVHSIRHQSLSLAVPMPSGVRVREGFGELALEFDSLERAAVLSQAFDSHELGCERCQREFLGVGLDSLERAALLFQAFGSRELGCERCQCEFLCVGLDNLEWVVEFEVAGGDRE